MKQRPPICRNVDAIGEGLALSARDVRGGCGAGQRCRRKAADVRSGGPLEVGPHGAAGKQQRGHDRRNGPYAVFTGRGHLARDCGTKPVTGEAIKDGAATELFVSGPVGTGTCPIVTRPGGSWAALDREELTEPHALEPAPV